MHLVIVILFKEEQLDDILSVFAELGLENALVVEGTRMQDVLAFDVPIFAGLAAGSMHDKRYIKMVMATTHEAGAVNRIKNVARDLDIDFSEPDTGIILALPISEIVTAEE